MKLASRSVRSRPVRSRNFTKAGWARPTTMAAPSTKNFVSMVSLCRVAMPFHMCEKRHWLVTPVSFEVTSKAPTNVLIAPALASDGLDTASLCFSLVSVGTVLTSLGFWPAAPDAAFPALAADCGCGIHMRVTPYGCADSSSGRNAEALIQEHLFQHREKHQNIGLLAAMAHQADAPDFGLQRPKTAGDFDVELIEQLVPYFTVVDALGNHYRGDRGQAVPRILDQQLQTHGFDACDQGKLI